MAQYIHAKIARHVGHTLAQRGADRIHVGPTWGQRSLLLGCIPHQVNRVFSLWLVQADNKENFIALHHCPFLTLNHQSSEDSPHKGTVMWKVFPCHNIIMTASNSAKGIKNGCPCIVEIRGTQGCALVGDPARAVGECRDVANEQYSSIG